MATPLRLPTLQERRQAERNLARHLAGDRLRIATATAFASHRSSRLPSVIPDFQDYQPPTSTTDYLEWEQFHWYTPHLATNRTILLPLGLSTAYASCTTQYSWWYMSIDAKRTWQPNYTGLPISWKYFNFEFSFVYSLFYAIYPKTTETLLPYSVAYIPQEYLPFTLKPFHHGPYQDHQKHLVYHQDSFAESYWNDFPYDCSCSCSWIPDGWKSFFLKLRQDCGCLQPHCRPQFLHS